MLIKAIVIIVFVIPIIFGVLLFLLKAKTMKQEDEAREYAKERAKREARRAMMREAARRGVRGTPRRRAA